MGESILRTLIELLEAQEQVKITYTIKEDENNGKHIKGGNDTGYYGGNAYGA